MWSSSPVGCCAFENTAAVGTTRLFIDLTARVQSGGESGLLGMAFHPNFSTNHQVFILSFTAAVNGQLVSRISEFNSATTAGHGSRSGKDGVHRQRSPRPITTAATSRSGPMVFSTSALAMAAAAATSGTIGNGQNVSTLLGKMLRIDVNGTHDRRRLTRIPPAIPIAATRVATRHRRGNCPEIYAYGFRNPWRWSFDRVSGRACGWAMWARANGKKSTKWCWRQLRLALPRGRACTTVAAAQCRHGPRSDRGVRSLGRFFHHRGFRLWGTAIAALVGRYVFGDFLAAACGASRADTAPTRLMQASDGFDTGLQISSFAQDANGELYIVDYGGTLHRVRAAN